MKRIASRLVALITVLGLVAASCADDDAATTTAPSTTEAATTTGAPTTTEAATTTEAPMANPADFNGDGVVIIGVATDGPRDDGGYYQAMVEKVEMISAENGFEPPIIVDQIDAANSRTALENLASQGVDIIAIGSEAVARGNEDLFTTYDEIFWYCNCGSGYQDTPGLFRSADSGAELNISAGYAAGLLLQEAGGDSAVFLGCCELVFENESLWGFEFGLQQVDPTFTVTYVPTGNFPYDFNNTAGATEAYNNAVAEGVGAVYPFLGGEANVPIAQLASEDGLIVNTAGSSKGCEREDGIYDFEVMFDAGDYLDPLFDEILAGTAVEGGVRRFTVGIDPQVGAVFCDATPEQVQMLDDFNKRIGAGDFAEQIEEILARAYGS